MFICTDCKRLYDEQPFFTENYGHGTPDREFPDRCRYCNGMIEEAKRCKVCGEYTTEDDITEGVCDACLYMEMKPDNVDAFLDHYTFTERTHFQLNPVIEHAFTDDEINWILLRELKNTLHLKHMMPTRLENALKSDLQDDWAQFLANTKGEY